MLLIAYIVLGLGIVNLLRVAVFLILSDAYDIRKSILSKPPKPSRPRLHHLSYTPKKHNYSFTRPGFNLLLHKAVLYPKLAKKLPAYSPLVSIIVPAHNEEKTLKRNLESILNSSYKKIELIIVNDSSTDKTSLIARKFQRQHRGDLKRIKVIDVNVRGKARALNAGLRHARGKLFMCLDADSAMAEKTLAYGVSHFRDSNVVTLSSNVKIFSGNGLLNLFQRIEYLVCYQMKKTETITNTQYIVGGIGSMFRTKLVKQLGGYETDTITEDIDLSMKIISKFGTKKRITYDPRMIVYTEAVTNLKGLFQQRYRWKYGRYQVFLKQRSLFLSTSKRQNKLLTWLYLPYALFAELTYMLEPLTFVLMFYLIWTYGDATMIAGSFLIFLFYTVIQVTGATSGYSFKERLGYVGFSPVAYFGMYVLSFVEYVATIRGFINLRKIIAAYKNGDGDCNWQHVERAGVAALSTLS